MFGRLYLTFQSFDLRERVFETCVSLALASVSGVDNLLLHGEGGLETHLVIVGSEPCAKHERRD
ncbi:MAG: hypothetical protein WB007_15345 [Candidatus Acidiferrales bacterium]